ncbi:MAG: hypothetical protein KKB21_04085, partial [Nanoarchaeota archaeon]|nr:hypothetical protein [Nanoarchaeota archaeon]
VVFAGIWYSRYGELGDVSWIYFITGVIALIFFLADGTIRRVMIKEEMRQMGYDNQEKYSRDIRREIDQARKDLDHDIITEGHYNRLVRKLRSKLKAISRH